MRVKSLLLLLAFIALIHCKSPLSSNIPVKEERLPYVKSFTANPSTVCSGEYSKLLWEVKYYEKIMINSMDVTTLNYKIVGPHFTTTTYTLTAMNAKGQVQVLCTVTVSMPQ